MIFVLIVNKWVQKYKLSRDKMQKVAYSIGEIFSNNFMISSLSGNLFVWCFEKMVWPLTVISYTPLAPGINSGVTPRFCFMVSARPAARGL